MQIKIFLNSATFSLQRNIVLPYMVCNLSATQQTEDNGEQWCRSLEKIYVLPCRQLTLSEY